MATRVEAVLADIEAEMVARGVEVTHYWGKRLAEARKTVNWVAWTEDDDAETVEPAYANSYELEAEGATPARAASAIYDRAIPLTIAICGEDKETSEEILDVLLAAAYQILTASAFTPSRAPKRGERATSRGHVRTLAAVIRIPVFSERLDRSTTILTTTLDAYATDANGDDAELADAPPPPPPDP